MKIESMDATMYANKPATTPPEMKMQIQQAQQVQQVQTEASEEKTVVEATQEAIQVQKPLSQITSSDLNEMRVSEKFLIQAIERANRAVLGRNTTFRFSIHEATKRISVTVLDKDTNEVIREIPPEKVLDVVAQMWDMAGLFVDERR